MKADNWQVVFQYIGNGIECDIDIAGNAVAVALGLKLAAGVVQSKLAAFTQAQLSIPLLSDLAMLTEAMDGRLKPYNGIYLNIKRLRGKAEGLTTSISVEWED